MSKVAFIKSASRRENVFNSLKLLKEDIGTAIGEKTILLKPNLVSVELQKASSYIDQIRGILDFLTGFYQGRIIIAEGACGDTMKGFENFGYFSLKNEYDFKMEFLDLNKDDFEEVPIFNNAAVKVSKTILDPNLFIVSAAKLKVHDTVIATLSIKNLLMGMVLFSDKTKMHQGIKEINQSLLNLAKRRMPDLASIDGFYGMEGEGPEHGELIKCEIAIASLDALAADRVGLEIMGIDPGDVGYLSYCYQAGLGEYNLDSIEILGNKLIECKGRKFKLHSTINEQLNWK